MDGIQPERYQRVVLATDGSTDAAAAAEFLASLDWPAKTEVAVVGVCTASVPTGSQTLPETGVGQHARRYLEMVQEDELSRTWENVAAAATRLRERQPEITVEEVVRNGEPAAEILADVEDRGADLVIAGARGHNALYTLLLGSVSEALVSDAPCPVLIARDHSSPKKDLHVLVGIGADDDAGRIAAGVTRLPLPAGTRVVAVSVEAGPGVPAADDSERRQLAEATRDWAITTGGTAKGASNRLAEHLRAGRPELAIDPRIMAGDIASELLAAAVEIEANLIVVGARERRGMLARLGLGSVSRKLVRRAECSVLVIRGGEAERRASE